MQRGYFKGKVLMQQDSAQMSPETPVDKRHASRRTRMTLNERIAAVHEVLVGHEKHADVAKKYRVKPVVIGQLLFKAKKNKTFLEELINKEQNATSKRQTIVKAVTALNDQGTFIGSVAKVINSIE